MLKHFLSFVFWVGGAFLALFIGAIAAMITRSNYDEYAAEHKVHVVKKERSTIQKIINAVIQTD